MTENNKNDKKLSNGSVKKTLSLGSKGIDLLARRIKKEKEQNKTSGKLKSVLEVVSGGKTSLKTDISKLSSLEYNHNLEKSNNSSDNVLQKNVNAEQLTEDEKKSRLEALKKAKESQLIDDTIKEDAPKEKQFMEFSIVRPQVSTVEPVIKKEKKPAHFKEVSKKDNEVIDDKSLKKKILAKKKDRNETERSWKDAYYEEDTELDIEEKVILEDEEVIEEILFKDNEYQASPQYYNNTAIKRVGKTKKDRYKNKNKIKKEIIITGQESIKTLSYNSGERIKDFLSTVESLGIEAQDGEDTILDLDTAELVILELGHVAKKYNPVEELMSIYKYKDDEKDLEPRPPIITIMGHVDHGKTTLLDYIRKTNVVSKESGGITQHIGAYQITTKDNKNITFLDTPGHEAFAEMRARGALVTDIIILVVAADDGLKQQSIEVINHANSANVPIIVAINKIDKPGANSIKVKTELLQHNVVVEDMGGKVLSVEVSALKGTGIDNLLESILLEAELLDLKANKKRNAIGTIIESRVEKGKGIVATVIVQNGTLKQGDIFIVGNSIGKVRLLHDDKGRVLKAAVPGMPVEVSGFNSEIKAGDELLVVNSDTDAKKLLDYKLNSNKKITNEIDDVSLLLSTTDDISYLPIILKTDVYGSKEAIIASLVKLGNNEVKIKVVHSGVGAINESDVLLAKTTGAIICGFNVRANNQAKILANNEKISITYYSIIYDLLDNLKESLSDMLQPKLIENILGYATIKEVFNVSKVGKIAGCVVTEGVIKKSSGVRLLRDNVVIYEGMLLQLKRFKDDTKEVIAGQECGVMLQNFQDIAKNDVIECFEKISEKRKL